MAVVVAVGTTVIATVVAMVKVALSWQQNHKDGDRNYKNSDRKIKINVAANVITIKTWFRHSRKRQIIKSECSVYERNTRSFGR